MYDEKNNSFSFDDITSVIVNRGTKEDFFDYDIEDANRLNQGTKELFDNHNWVPLPTELLYYLIGREDSEYLEYENNKGYATSIPTNIKSIKKQNKIK